MPLFLMRPATENYEILKIFGEKFWTHEIPTRRNLESTRKNPGPTKHPGEKNLDSRNTHEKKFETRKIPTRKKFGTHEIPIRKYFEPTKYPREKIFDPRNTHGAKMTRWHWTHETHDGTRPTKFCSLVMKETQLFFLSQSRATSIQFGLQFVL